MKRTVEQAHSRIDEIDKKLVKIETRIDEKFIGIDGRLKSIDIRIDNFNDRMDGVLMHIDKKFTHMMIGGLIGLVTLVSILLTKLP